MFVKISILLKMIFNLLAFSGFLLLYVHFTQRMSLFIADKLLLHRRIRLNGLQDQPTHRERHVRGKLALHEWNNLCNTSSQELYKSTVFPKYPDILHFINDSILKPRSHNSGRRLSGYLHPPETGYYMFLVKSSGDTKLWISETEFHENVKLAASVQTESRGGRSTGGEKFEYSTETFLNENTRHPIEIFHFGAVLKIYWIKPGKHQFEILSGSHISHDTKSLGHEVLSSVFHEKRRELGDEIALNNFSLIAFISPKWVRDNALSKCPLVFKDVITARKRSISVYLKTNVEIILSDLDGKKLQEERVDPDVKHLIGFYLERLEYIYPKRFKLKRVHNVEKFSLSTKHKPLYLMELELHVDGLDYPERVVEYICKANLSHFCYPGLTWNKDAFINILVVVKNETKWIQMFIDKLEKVFKEALEVDMHLIVVDFQDTGVNVEKVLNKTTLKGRFTINKMDGPYSKSRALNSGVSLVKGKHPIILACDVHVDIPNTIFEDTKKHCIEGRMAFSPVVFQLDRCSHPGTQNPSGTWCFHGYDVIGIFKSDWTRVSGMDETLVEQKADWDLVERLDRLGLSIARFKYPGLYRYYVPRKPKIAKNNNMELGYLQKDV